MLHTGIDDFESMLLQKLHFLHVLLIFLQFRSKHLSYGDNYPTLEEFVLMPNGSINQEYPPGHKSIKKITFLEKIFSVLSFLHTANIKIISKNYV